MKKTFIIAIGVSGALALMMVFSGALALAAEKDASAAGGNNKSVTAEEGKKLLEANCVKCHAIEKTTGYKGSDAWDGIVKRMAKKKNANISDDAAAKIISYLDTTYPRKK